MSTHMSFIFHAIQANTYSIFCLCVNFIIIFGYSSLYFPQVDLLSKDLIVCMLIWQAAIYIFYIVNFVIFDINVFLTPEMNKNDNIATTESMDENNSKTKPPVNINTGILLNILLCEIIILISLCSVWIVSLYECGQDTGSVMCYTTWGKHPANFGIGATILLITVSILFSTLVVYKQIVYRDSFVSLYFETYLVAFSLLVNLIIKSKMVRYHTVCITNFNVVWYSNIPECVAFYALFICQIVVSFLIYASSEGTEKSEAHLYRSVARKSILKIVPQMLSVVIVVQNFINLYEVSIAINAIHAVIVLSISFSSAYSIIFPGLAVEKHKKK